MPAILPYSELRIDSRKNTCLSMASECVRILCGAQLYCTFLCLGWHFSTCLTLLEDRTPANNIEEHVEETQRRQQHHLTMMYSVLHIVGWHYLSNATSLIRPRLFYVCFIVSRITIICLIIYHL